MWTRAQPRLGLHKNSPDVSVITNSLDIATTLQEAQKDVLLLGGRMSTDVPATMGELTLSEIARFHVDLCFSSPVAVHPTKGAFFYDLQESEVAIAMARQAQRTIILANHSKLGETSRILSFKPDAIDTLVTNRAPTDLIASFQENGVDVFI